MQTPTFDLRPLAPPQRHALAFQCFDALASGESLELLSDHEPRGLLAAFLQQRPGAFDWQVLEPGPESWRIRVQRIQDAAAPRDAARSGGCSCSCSRH